MARRGSLAGAAAVMALAFGQSADATSFVLTSLNAGTAPGTDARRGFEIAAAYWSSVLTDNVTINLNIGFSNLGANILGQTNSASAIVYNPVYYSALSADRTSSLDAKAVDNLRPLTAGSGSTQGTGAVTAIGNALNAKGDGYLDTSTRIDNDGSANNRSLDVNTAVAKALGITTDYKGAAINYANPDGSVQFSNAYSFDFNPSDGIAAGSIDFIGIAIHEIGHALGFVSGVDNYDFYTSPGTSNVTAGALENTAGVATPLDLFRYSSAGNLDWSTQNTPYFSIDGGKTQLNADSLFSTGPYNGDGRQASHWKDDLGLGIMDPTAAFGEELAVTALDLGAFDAIGWNLKIDVLSNLNYRETTGDIYRQFATDVPEPASWATMILGLGMVGGTARYRRRRVAVRYA